MKEKTYTNFHSFILNEGNWRAMGYVTTNKYRHSRFREYRTKLKMPSTKIMLKWIDEDYRFINPDDQRETREIAAWMAQTAEN